MKAVHFLILVCAVILPLGPVYAHGDEAHDPATNAAASSEPSQEATGMSGMQSASGQSAEAGHGSDGHDDASGGHESVSEGDFVLSSEAASATIHSRLHVPVAAFAEFSSWPGEALQPNRCPRADLWRCGRCRRRSPVRLDYRPLVWRRYGHASPAGGMLIAALGLALAALAYRPRKDRVLLRTGLFAMAALILLQGFLGGELAHGPDHLGLSWI